MLAELMLMEPAAQKLCYANDLDFLNVLKMKNSIFVRFSSIFQQTCLLYFFSLCAKFEELEHKIICGGFYDYLKHPYL